MERLRLALRLGVKEEHNESLFVNLVWIEVWTKGRDGLAKVSWFDWLIEA